MDYLDPFGIRLQTVCSKAAFDFSHAESGSKQTQDPSPARQAGQV
jgi:hypothetical protein